MRIYKIVYASFCLLILVAGCKPSKPAATAVNFTIKVDRFDSAFFAIDTNQLSTGLKSLQQNYPEFSKDFFMHIIGVNMDKDSSLIKIFYRQYLPIYVAAKNVNAPQKISQALSDAYGRFHQYFPAYALSNKIIYFIGPLEGYGNIVTKEGLAVGLQMHLGATSPWYFSDKIQSLYPTYFSRKFEYQYIPVISLQNILEDYAPARTMGKNLLTQMIESGKRQYIIEKCFPNTPDSIIWGYTQKQLKALDNNKNEIWSFMVAQKLLYSLQPSDSRDFMNAAKYNQFFGEEIPGDVGRYMGYQIVAAWMDRQTTKLQADLSNLLKVPAQQIFEESKFNP